MIACIGIDPGRSSGLALVVRDDGRPHDRAGRLVFSARILDPGRRERWLERGQDAIQTALGALPPGVVPRVVIENPPPVSRTARLAGDRHGQSTWFGLGRRVGAWEVLCWQAGLSWTLLSVADWTRQLSPVCGPKKHGDGAHRIREAGRLLVDATALDRVDVAEAALIATAGLLREVS